MAEVGSDGELPSQLAALADDERVIGELRLIFQRNSRHEDGAKRYLADAEADRLARQALERMLDPDGFRLAEVGGLRFYLQIGDELYPEPNEIQANSWDGTQWRPIGRVPLDIGDPT